MTVGALTVALMWAAAAAVVTAGHLGGHPTDVRRRARALSNAGHRSPSPTGARSTATDAARGWRAVAALGRAARRAGLRPADPMADRRVGLALVAAALLAPVAPLLAPVPLAGAALAPALARRRAKRARDVAVVDQLPDLVDLLTLTTDAGLPVSAALGAIADRPGGPLGAAVGRATEHVARGGTTAGALATLADGAGPGVRNLVDVLAEHDRYGTPLRPALARAGIEARMRRRRQAEEAARRLPVTLLFPLVLTTLPAFFLLAIVPLLAGSLGSLSP
jgi:tight adherence protein C